MECNGSYCDDHALEMVFTRQTSRAAANPEYLPRTYQQINILEVRATSQTVFTQEHNELFVQQVLQNSQDFEGENLHYRVLC